jgi:hypothetical protein
MVALIDPSAFVVIEQAHTAYGGGFKEKPTKVKLPEGLKNPEVRAEVFAGD